MRFIATMNKLGAGGGGGPNAEFGIRSAELEKPSFSAMLQRGRTPVQGQPGQITLGQTKKVPRRARRMRKPTSVNIRKGVKRVWPNLAKFGQIGPIYFEML